MRARQLSCPLLSSMAPAHDGPVALLKRAYDAVVDKKVVERQLSKPNGSWPMQGWAADCWCPRRRSTILDKNNGVSA